MKALKEKRISLRSLWRRGLVILSLFALVFASCSDSSGGGATDSGGPRIVSIAVKEDVANHQYLGQPFDLTGLTLLVKTADGNVTETKPEDIAKMTTIPRVVTGEYVDWAESASAGWWFNENREYKIVYYNAEYTYTVPNKIKFFPIYKSISIGPNDVGDSFRVQGSYDTGIHVTGAETMKQRTAYVDDDVFDFGGLALEADYWINYPDVKDLVRSGTVSVPEIQRKKISFGDITWEIVPRYDRAKKNAVGYYDGYVLITAGQDLDWAAGDGLPSYWYDDDDVLWWNAKGLTAVLPLDAVYTVEEIKLQGANDVSKYFFWEENTRAKWLGKLGDGAYLDVTYTDKSTKQKWIKDLKEKSRIYLNANPDEGYNDDWTEDGVYYGPDDFDIMTIRYPITKKSGDLGIILYYRGAQYPIKVSVYATLLKLEATPSITFWPDPTWDNDIDNGERGPIELSKQIEVKAWYAAINDANDQQDIVLTYFWDPDRDPNTPYKTGPYYLFAASEDVNDEDEADEREPGGPGYSGTSTYAKGYQKYLNNYLKGKGETTTKVTVRHDISAYTALENILWVKYGVVYTSEDLFGHDNAPSLAEFTSAFEDGYSLFSCGITNWYEKVFKDNYYKNRTTSRAWYDHYPYGMLPNGWSPYNEGQKKQPWGYIYYGHPTIEDGTPVTVEGVTPKNTRYVVQDPSRNFGTKLDQKKKAKIDVTWVNHKP